MDFPLFSRKDHMTERQIKALQTIQHITRRSFDIFGHLAGPHKAGIRAQIMSDLRGIKVPQSKAGVTAIREELYTLSGIVPSQSSATTWTCEADREEQLMQWANTLLSREVSCATQS